MIGEKNLYVLDTDILFPNIFESTVGSICGYGSWGYIGSTVYNIAQNGKNF